MRAGCIYFALLATICLELPIPDARADEGFWLFNDPPRKLLKERYNFELSDRGLDKFRQATLQVSDGGTASFVSGDGLVLTNRHVIERFLNNVRANGKNIHRDGFIADSRIRELPCPDLQLQIVIAIEDVTERIQQAVKSTADPAEGAKAREAAIEAVASSCLGPDEPRGEVVCLFGGLQYQLYRLSCTAICD
jgi:hypothetical protein